MKSFRECIVLAVCAFCVLAIGCESQAKTFTALGKPTDGGWAITERYQADDAAMQERHLAALREISGKLDTLDSLSTKIDAMPKTASVSEDAKAESAIDSILSVQSAEVDKITERIEAAQTALEELETKVSAKRECPPECNCPPGCDPAKCDCDQRKTAASRVESGWPADIRIQVFEDRTAATAADPVQQFVTQFQEQRICENGVCRIVQVPVQVAVAQSQSVASRSPIDWPSHAEEFPLNGTVARQHNVTANPTIFVVRDGVVRRRIVNPSSVNTVRMVAFEESRL